jgi:hypothetical protein
MQHFQRVARSGCQRLVNGIKDPLFIILVELVLQLALEIGCHPVYLPELFSITIL